MRFGYPPVPNSVLLHECKTGCVMYRLPLVTASLAQGPPEGSTIKERLLLCTNILSRRRRRAASRHLGAGGSL